MRLVRTCTVVPMSGVTTVEYGLIVAGVAIASLARSPFFKPALDDGFDRSTSGPGLRACAPRATNCTVGNVMGTLPQKVIPVPLVPPPAPGSLPFLPAPSGPGDGVVTLTWTAATSATRYLATGVPCRLLRCVGCDMRHRRPCSAVQHSFTVRAFNISTPGPVSNIALGTNSRTDLCRPCNTPPYRLQVSMLKVASRNPKYFSLGWVSIGNLMDPASGSTYERESPDAQRQRVRSSPTWSGGLQSVHETTPGLGTIWYCTRYLVEHRYGPTTDRPEQSGAVS